MNNLPFVKGYPNILSPAEAATLEGLAQNNTVLEVGSYRGASTIVMARVARKVMVADSARPAFRQGVARSWPRLFIRFEGNQCSFE
jgi:protein-L-isoaspartate O-methyltransferase